MLIRYGYELSFECFAPTLMLGLLDAHEDRAHHIVYDGGFSSHPAIDSSYYKDSFGNLVHKFMAPTGALTIRRDSIIDDSGTPDPVVEDAQEVALDRVPNEYLVYLLGSRYCETDKLSQIAWDLFGTSPRGWRRVRAICDFVNAHVTFGYQYARNTRTAFETYEEKVGVCRDFSHLAVALCRCMNIPARYTNGFLGDIGVPKDPSPMDYSAFFEAFLDGQWFTFDARHNKPRIGRILVSRGRDATDIPLVSSFGPHTLTQFKVWTDEIDQSVLDGLTRQSARA
jgi:transglutaminase-like putative cysteine protease